MSALGWMKGHAGTRPDATPFRSASTEALLRLPIYRPRCLGPMLFVFFNAWLYNLTGSELLCIQRGRLAGVALADHPHVGDPESFDDVGGPVG
jgi:hypothetical protein